LAALNSVNATNWSVEENQRMLARRPLKSKAITVNLVKSCCKVEYNHYLKIICVAEPTYYCSSWEM